MCEHRLHEKILRQTQIKKIRQNIYTQLRRTETCGEQKDCIGLLQSYSFVCL